MSYFKCNKSIKNIHKKYSKIENKANQEKDRKTWNMHGSTVTTYTTFDIYDNCKVYHITYNSTMFTWATLKRSFKNKDEANEFFKSLKEMSKEEFDQMRYIY